MAQGVGSVDGGAGSVAQGAGSVDWGQLHDKASLRRVAYRVVGGGWWVVGAGCRV